jgi:hypothetical protein
MPTGQVLAGNLIIAQDVQDELNALPRAVIRRASRPTSSTAAATAQPVLRLDSVPLLAGRRYQIITSTLIIRPTVAADRGTARLSMSTSGAATTASTLYAVLNTPNIDSATDGMSVVLSFTYTPAANETVSILLWHQRLSGTGNINFVVTGGTTIDIEVIDLGLDPGDTGVDL